MLCQAHAPTLAPPHHKTTELARHQIEMAQQAPNPLLYYTVKNICYKV